MDDVAPALEALGHRPVPLTLPGQGDGSASAQDRHGMGRCAEGRFSHADHGDAELGGRARAQAGPAVRVEIGIAVDHQQAHLAQAVQDRAQRWEFSQVELAGLVGQRGVLRPCKCWDYLCVPGAAAMAQASG